MRSRGSESSNLAFEMLNRDEEGLEGAPAVLEHRAGGGPVPTRAKQGEPRGKMLLWAPESAVWVDFWNTDFWNTKCVINYSLTLNCVSVTLS